MIARLRKISLVDIILVIVLVAVTAVTYNTSQVNADVEKERTTQERRSQAIAENLNDADRAATLESLNQRLDQLRSTPIADPLPTREEAIASTDKVLQYAQANSVNITGFNTSDVSITLGGKNYPGIRHNLVVSARANGLTGFTKALTLISTASAIQRIEITSVGGENNTWQMSFELIIYYKED